MNNVFLRSSIMMDYIIERHKDGHELYLRTLGFSREDENETPLGPVHPENEAIFNAELAEDLLSEYRATILTVVIDPSTEATFRYKILGNVSPHETSEFTVPGISDDSAKDQWSALTYAMKMAMAHTLTMRQHHGLQPFNAKESKQEQMSFFEDNYVGLEMLLDLSDVDITEEQAKAFLGLA